MNDRKIGGKRDKAHGGGRKTGPKPAIQGVVKARTCKHCGHHEIGIITRTGEYIPLKPGMTVAVLEDGRNKDRNAA